MVETDAMSKISKQINGTQDLKTAILSATRSYESIMGKIKLMEKNKGDEDKKTEKSGTIDVGDIRKNVQRLRLEDIEGR